jgi:hypothetical protein
VAIAALSDVKRLLRITDTSKDREITKALEAAEDWVRRRTRRSFGDATNKMVKFYNVQEDELLYLPDDNCTVSAVSAYYRANSSGTSLVADADYQVIDGHTVQLTPTLEFAPFEGAVASRVPGTYERVEVTYSATPEVPPTVREATAMFAAALYAKGPNQAQGIESESLGDYNYYSTKDDDLVPDVVTTMLGPYVRHRIRST